MLIANRKQLERFKNHHTDEIAFKQTFQINKGAF